MALYSPFMYSSLLDFSLFADLPCAEKAKYIIVLRVYLVLVALFLFFVKLPKKYPYLFFLSD